ncbi:unnamed protein product [Sphenostylis stenocarpa]|uniref:Uncharacterized protein n=1 Tax=Sphenostylis stenocarpa TaxID=92480 RepID=A0AA86T073_9FABA|nr:unnamed protein product [Sphenostylis stenocarpa]
MESSMRLEYLMTVFAVSGGMVLLFHQVNKHLCNKFLKKFEYEIRGSAKHEAKKRVRFAKDMVELIPMKNVQSDSINLAREQEVIEKVMVLDDAENWKHDEKSKDVMPPNRAVKKLLPGDQSLLSTGFRNIGYTTPEDVLHGQLPEKASLIFSEFLLDLVFLYNSLHSPLSPCAMAKHKGKRNTALS